MKKRWLSFVVSFFKRFHSKQTITSLCIHGFMRNKGYIDGVFNSQHNYYNYNDFFKDIKRFLKNPDFTIGNSGVILGTKSYLGDSQF